MSYLKIGDPEKRDSLVKSYLESKKNICERNLAEKVGELQYKSDLYKFFKPGTEAQKKSTEEIKKGLKPIEDEMKVIRENIRLPDYPQVKMVISRDGEITMEEEEEKTNIGKLAYEFLLRFGEKGDTDKSLGLYTKKGNFFIGNKKVNINDNDFTIGDKTYKGTRGIWDLITSKTPDEEKITEEDRDNYREILMNSKAIYRKFNPLQRHPNSSSSIKWKTYGSPLWKIVKGEIPVTGTGTIIIPSDPNALIKRLDLLLKSKAAGNTGVRNELVSVCDELKRQGHLNAKMYKKLMSLL